MLLKYLAIAIKDIKVISDFVDHCIIVTLHSCISHNNR